MLFLYRRGNPDKCTASRTQTDFTTLTTGTPSATDPSSQASILLGFQHYLTMHGWPNLFNVGFMLVTLYFYNAGADPGFQVRGARKFLQYFV
jgi:hypothetical protein